MVTSFTRFLDTHNDAPQSVGLLCTSDQLCRRDLYLTSHTTHKRQTSMPPVGFETTISAGERPQTSGLRPRGHRHRHRHRLVQQKSFENPTGAPEINIALRTPSDDKVHSYTIKCSEIHRASVADRIGFHDCLKLFGWHAKRSLRASHSYSRS
jgi:hypothetical protein